MKMALVIITCPGREAYLEATLKSLSNTDFELPFGEQVLVQRDTNTCERKQERQERNSLSALQNVLAEDRDAEVILFCEDDIIFNRHLRHNLEHWSPLKNYCGPRRDATPGMPAPSVKQHFFGSLYDPNIRELDADPDIIEEWRRENYFIADPNAVYGSQCFVMSRAMAEYICEHWWEVEGMQDIKMSRLAARLGKIHYHHPSLVQHIGYQSTWTSDARFHDTKTFNPEFKKQI